MALAQAEDSTFHSWTMSFLPSSATSLGVSMTRCCGYTVSVRLQLYRPSFFPGSSWLSCMAHPIACDYCTIAANRTICPRQNKVKHYGLRAAMES